MSRLLPESNAQAGSGVRNLSARSPIRDYTLISNCHGCGLVSRFRSIDLVRLRPLRCATYVLPPAPCGKGGSLSVRLVGDFEAGRGHLDGTSILRTTFTTTTGQIAMNDYMPLGRRQGASAHDYVSLSAPGLLIRTIPRGCCRDADIRFRPSIDYAPTRVRLVVTSQGESPA